jgi:protease-4
MSKTKKIWIGVAAAVFILLIVGIVAIALLFGTLDRTTIAQNSVLVLDISGEMPDYAPNDPLAESLGMSSSRSFTGLMTQIRKAKADSRIGAVLLDIDFPGIGWGKATELRDAIKDLRAAGKPVYAYMEIGTNREYYIATAAEKIFVPPTGDLYVNGLAAEAMFYKGSLDKLGVEADVIQIGPKYKNAPDQYTKTKMGEGQAEVMNAIVDEYYNTLVNAIAESRGKSADEVKTMIDSAPHNAVQAKELGLIDDAVYREQVDELLKQKLGYAAETKLRTVSRSAYKDVTPSSLGLENGERIAVIYASGVINVGSSLSSPISGDIVGSDTVVKAVNDAANDKSVKAIVLRVDSPGGSALASDLMWYALENAKAKKPVVVSMSDVAASGGYYIACNANKIIAEPTTITGSIGMFMGKPIVKGMYDWLGVSNEYVMRGKNAGIFRETEKWTPEERTKMEEMANNVYFSNFVPKVAQGRGKTNEEVDTLGQGRVWTGTQAKENGLVDDFGGLEKAIQTAKELAGLPADKDVKRVIFPAPVTLIERLLGGGGSQASDDSAARALAETLPTDAKKALRFAQIFEQMKRGDAMLLMPYELTIK